MRLYLSAESKQNIGYTPDWLKVQFNQDGKEFELTLDIQGTIDYSPDTLSCRCKGELIPWVLWDLDTGDETDLSSLSTEELECIWPDKKIADIVCNSRTYEIGIYPVCDNDEILELAKEDVLTNRKGCFEMYIDKDNQYNVDFEFYDELNIY
jgi:hypothetical protein